MTAIKSPMAGPTKKCFKAPRFDPTLVASVYWKNGDRVVYYRLNFEDRRAIRYPDDEMWLSRRFSRFAR